MLRLVYALILYITTSIAFKGYMDIALSYYRTPFHGLRMGIILYIYPTSISHNLSFFIFHS